VHVEHDDLRLLVRGRRGRLLERGGLDDPVPAELQVQPSQEANRGVVVDDQDGQGRHGGRV
jgi:hypothetical protein